VREEIGKHHLTYGQGTAAEIKAMFTVGAANWFGLPVRTTQVLSSGGAGTMPANRTGLQCKHSTKSRYGMGADSSRFHYVVLLTLLGLQQNGCLSRLVAALDEARRRPWTAAPERNKQLSKDWNLEFAMRLCRGEDDDATAKSHCLAD
jgi:hypothetical protein